MVCGTLNARRCLRVEVVGVALVDGVAGDRGHQVGDRGGAVVDGHGFLVVVEVAATDPVEQRRRRDQCGALSDSFWRALNCATPRSDGGCASPVKLAGRRHTTQHSSGANKRQPLLRGGRLQRRSRGLPPGLSGSDKTRAGRSTVTLVAACSCSTPSARLAPRPQVPGRGTGESFRATFWTGFPGRSRTRVGRADSSIAARGARCRTARSPGPTVSPCSRRRANPRWWNPAPGRSAAAASAPDHYAFAPKFRLRATADCLQNVQLRQPGDPPAPAVTAWIPRSGAGAIPW